MSPQLKLKLSVLPGRYAVARLGRGAAVPAWARRGGLWSVTRAGDELSVVTAEENVPARVRAERGWRALKLHGPFPFTATGILASVLAPLARARISIFALSTFDTDYVLVKEADLPRALRALRRAGHRVVKSKP